MNTATNITSVARCSSTWLYIQWKIGVCGNWFGFVLVNWFGSVFLFVNMMIHCLFYFFCPSIFLLSA
ncbi:hypothetical protein RchiOBHm_Chr6g0293171 [Rosa chinensis]|uniref:Uncharacterized protein n=1 Tax=Rosa chinensis TaxID=74649 RepID=A0A2P6PWK3_ROSCH|nr:hypothetical protein RchiOBHm_Chr6g0293171 [Rosa chinensis]